MSGDLERGNGYNNLANALERREKLLKNGLCKIPNDHIPSCKINFYKGHYIIFNDNQWSYSWEVTDYYPSGQYTFSVEATDMSGNTNSDVTSPNELNPRMRLREAELSYSIKLAALAVNC